jgi:hypothetical protein
MVTNPSAEQVRGMYQAAMAAGAIDVPALSPKGRKRRVESLKWTTLAKHARIEASAVSAAARAQAASGAAAAASDAAGAASSDSE